MLGILAKSPSRATQLGVTFVIASVLFTVADQPVRFDPLPRLPGETRVELAGDIP